MRILSGAQVAQLVGVADLIEPIAAAMVEVSRGNVEMPLRSMVKLPGANHMGIMGGHLGTPAGHGVKVLSLYPENPKYGRSSHSGLFLLFDGVTGLPVLCMDAAVLTAIRTAASTAVGSRVLARKDSKVLAILGLGEQAHSHIAAMRAVHPIERIVAWGRDRAKLEAFGHENGVEIAGSAAEAVRGADIIVTATPAKEPFLSLGMLSPGQHVNECCVHAGDDTGYRGWHALRDRLPAQPGAAGGRGDRGAQGRADRRRARHCGDRRDHRGGQAGTAERG
jgi:ornithine cyclodeaminase/alanine dehydrogenase-like protein (mu-crystallin family)